MAAQEDTRLLIGKIVGVFGVEGWVKIESFAEPRVRIFKYQPWYVTVGQGGEREFVGAEGHAQGKGMVARLPGVGDRDAAAALLGAEIHILRSALPKPKRGEYYWTDLEGLGVRNVEGVDLGRVSHLFSTGANDVVVVTDGQGRERLIPFITGQFVREVDIDGRAIVVDWDPEF